MGEKKGKRKGLGGLSPEKKKLLKQLIMQKAAEDLKKQNEAEAEIKRKIISARLPPLDLSGLDKGALDAKVKELHTKVVGLEEDKYDWEVKIRRQDVEVNELTIKVNDVKGKFVKPVLKKVSKTEQKMAKFDKEKLKSKLGGFRDQLKSTGQSKFAMDEKEESKKPDWTQDSLKHKEKSDEKDDDEEEGEAEEDEEEEEEEEEEE